MKTISCLALSGTILALALSSGCKSAGSEKADSTAMHMDDLRVATTALKEKVSAVAESLAQVVEKAEVDPKPAFDKYKTSVSAMQDALSRAESNLNAMRSQGQTYFTEWQKQAEAISDPDLKQRAAERREKLSKAVAEVSDAMKAARDEIAPYSKTSADLQTYLSNDLTPAGIKSVKDKSKQHGKDASSIGKKLDDVVEALAKGAPEFKTAKPPPPPPPEKAK